MIVEDRRLAFALGEDLQDAAARRARCAAGQLAVAERAGAPFAEQVIAFGIVRPAVVEGGHVADPLADGLAAFEHQRPIASLGEKIGREGPGRPRADDDRSLSQWFSPRGGNSNGASR